MNNAKTTRKALLTSVMALVICVTMLMGTTFAWFTDTATVAVNKIQSGTLKIDLVDAEGNTLVGAPLEFIDKDENDLWEPGCRYTLPDVYVKNLGNLAVKYEVVITGINGDAKLNEAIEWTIDYGYEEGTNQGHLAVGDELSEPITISGTMKTTAGNEFQGLSIGGIAITVLATQDTVEKDSIDETYDAAASVKAQNAYDLEKAGYSVANTADALIAAFNEGKNVVLANNIDLGNITASGLTVPKGANIVMDLNGYTITAVDAKTGGNNEVIMNNGTLTIKDSAATGKITISATTDRSWNALSAVVSNLGTLNVEGGTLQHLGGTAMSYGIDMRSVTHNDIVTNITGGNVDSSYIGIRLFTNATHTNDLTVSGGVVSGERLSVWIQSSNNTNNASVNVSGDALLDGNFMAYHTSDTITVNIPDANLSGEVE